MKATLGTACLTAGLVIAATGAALAQSGNSNSGSGLSPYAADSGNDRSAGVNNGNYTLPQYRAYRRAYGPRDVPYTPTRRYYGYPY